MVILYKVSKVLHGKAQVFSSITTAVTQQGRPRLLSMVPMLRTSSAQGHVYSVLMVFNLALWTVRPVPQSHWRQVAHKRSLTTRNCFTNQWVEPSGQLLKAAQCMKYLTSFRTQPTVYTPNLLYSLLTATDLHNCQSCSQTNKEQTCEPINLRFTILWDVVVHLQCLMVTQVPQSSEHMGLVLTWLRTQSASREMEHPIHSSSKRPCPVLPSLQ